jgi:hypothetical protein
MPIFGTSIIATFFPFGYQIGVILCMKALSKFVLFIYFINNRKPRLVFCFGVAKMKESLIEGVLSIYERTRGSHSSRWRRD